MRAARVREYVERLVEVPQRRDVTSDGVPPLRLRVSGGSFLSIPAAAYLSQAVICRVLPDYDLHGLIAGLSVVRWLDGKEIAMDKRDRPTRGTSMATPIIAENLRRLLHETGMQGKELAERIRVSPQSISQWLTGQLVPTKQRLAQIAQILQVEVDDLTRDMGESTSIPIKCYSLDLSPQAPPNQRLVLSAMRIFLPWDLASRYYGCPPPEEMAAIQVKDHNLEPTVLAGDELFVDLSWRAVTLSDLYLLDFGGFPLFRWCHLVTHETVNVSDQRMDQDFPAGDLAVLGRVVGRMSVGSIRK